MSLAEKSLLLKKDFDDVYEKGKEAEYNAFWDKYQNKGTQGSYAYAFYSSRWNESNYKPKYDIIATNANSIFQQTNVKDTLVGIDITNTNGNSVNMFQYSSRIETIHKLIVNEKCQYKGCFTSCTGLKDIEFEGTIGTDISFANSPLTVESMKSVIEHLKDCNEYTYTVTFKGLAFDELEKEGTTAEYDGVTCTWAELIDNKKWNLVKA